MGHARQLSFEVPGKDVSITHPPIRLELDCMLGSPKSAPITHPPTPKTGIGVHARHSQVYTHHAPTHKTGIGLHARQLSFEVPGKDVSITHPPTRLELDCMLGSPKSAPITHPTPPPLRLELDCMLGS